MLVKRNDKNNNLIMLNKVLCLLFLFYTNNLCLSYDLPEVKTPLGKVLGIWKTSFCGRKYAAFLGIPYAKPPVGELRFEEPQPVEPWTEVLNATQTYTCLQSSFFNIREAQGTEDCLYLNVYVPIETIDPQKSFDVLVIIHGGAFIFGSGHMFADSKILMDRDLVVVSINYRLGFLALSTKLQQIEDSWSEIAHYLLLYNYTLPAIRREEVAEKIKEFYLGPGEHINKKNFNKFSQIFTDRLYTIDAEKAAKLQSRLNGSPVYYYYFNYREGGGKMAQLLAADINVEGVVHGEDGIYFYTNLFFPMSESDMKLRNACQDMLYSFAKTGKPSFDGTENWQPTKESQLIYLNVTGPENMELQQIEHLAPSEFWRKLGLLEKENLTFNDKL